MADLIIKAAPDRELYMEWSTVANGPTFVGTRTETAAYLEQRGRQPADPPGVRLQRAGATGTSAIADPRDPHDNGPLTGAWDSDGLLVEQAGWLPRARFAEFMQTLAANDGDETTAYGLLEPLAD